MKIILKEEQYRKLTEGLMLHHGSPKTIKKFSTRKIGSGMGVTIYGWGLYFTSSKSIAEYYRNCLKNKDQVKIGDNDIRTFIRFNLKFDDEHFNEKHKFLRTLDELQDLNKALEIIKSDSVKEWFKKEIKPKLKIDTGGVYCVTFKKGKNPNQFLFLDWAKVVDVNILQMVANKIIKKKPKLKDEIEDNFGLSDSYYGDYPTTENFYGYLSSLFNSDKTASLFLKNCGIDGIKFKANEDVSKEGDINYVIFDPKFIDIDDVLK